MLYLRTAAEVQQAADAMIDRVKLARPGRASMDCWCKAWPIALAPELRVVVEHDPSSAR